MGVRYVIQLLLASLAAMVLTDCQTGLACSTHHPEGLSVVSRAIAPGLHLYGGGRAQHIEGVVGASPPPYLGIPSCDAYLGTYMACHRVAGIFPPGQLGYYYANMCETLWRDAHDPAMRPQLANCCKLLMISLHRALHGKSCHVSLPRQKKLLQQNGRKRCALEQRAGLPAWREHTHSSMVRPKSYTTKVIAALKKKIDTLIHLAPFAHAAWGIDVVSLDSGLTLYTHRAHRLLLPASTAKLYVAALVLETMGGSAHIATRLLGTGALHQGQLDGALILQGMGDPALGSPDTNTDWADQLARQLLAHNVHYVHGDLIADDSYFSGSAIGAGWEVDDLPHSYAAPAAALSLNENTVTLSVQPGSHPGLPAQLRFTPGDLAPRLINTTTTSAPGVASHIRLYRALGSDTLHVFGHVPADTPPRMLPLAISDPARLAAKLLCRALEAHGIEVTGHVRVLHWPQDDRKLLDQARVLAEVFSPPLSELLTAGLKRSENLYLQNFLQIVGVKVHAHASLLDSDYASSFHSSAAWGLHALGSLLDQAGIARSEVLLEDGTGISRKDLTTPAALIDLLRYVARKPYATALRQSLPIACVDGTLKSRMCDTVAAGRVQAKTGSMSYVGDLAGYITTVAGEHLAFAIMLNHYHKEDEDQSRQVTTKDKQHRQDCQQQEDTTSAAHYIDTIVALLTNFRAHGHLRSARVPAR